MAEQTVVLRNPVDTHAGSTNASQNHGANKKLRIQSGEAYAYIFFNRPFPLGSTIVNATLRLYTAGSWGITPTLGIRRVSERWGAYGLTWNNRPTVAGAATETTQSSTGDGDLWEFDLTSMMQLVSDGGVWFGVRVETTNTSATKYLWSSNAVDFSPELEVTWSNAPQAPTTLTPSGSAAVAIAKPILRFDFTDNRGNTALDAVNVQIDSDGTFASPEFDSGTVLATEPELDLADTAYAGLSAGSETRWRVRVRDGSGLWSEWSDVARFRRDNKGTLTIDNPGAAPNDVVYEWTPPIIWSLTGETQKAWQVIVTPADDRGTHLDDSGRRKGTDTSYTLPKAVIEDDSDYRVIVRVWDSKDRAGTPGDPLYTQAERVFRFTEDPTPNPVTSLAANNLLPRPWAEVTWSRSAAPDYFVVKRNGKVVDTNLDPADYLTTGTSYRYVDRDAQPYRTHEWVVQAVVNGKTSTGNPSVTESLTSQGIWLYDHDRDIELFIQGNDEGAWAAGEEGTTHYPVASSKGVRITQAVRGWEGTISGRLANGAGKTAEQWENNFWAIKARPGRTMTLTLGNESFRCVVWNMLSQPTPTVPVTKVVSFEFAQTGRLPYDVRW